MYTYPALGPENASAGVKAAESAGAAVVVAGVREGSPGLCHCVCPAVTAEPGCCVGNWKVTVCKTDRLRRLHRHPGSHTYKCPDNQTGRQ